jgi:hypothetical protein
MCTVAEQLGADALHALQGVGQRARLLEDLLLHVVAVGPQFGGAAVRVHRAHRAVDGAVAPGRPLRIGRRDPHAAQLQVDHVAFFQVDDLVGHAGQRHRVAGQEVFALALAAADAQHQRRALPRADHAVRFVAREDRDGVGAAQPRQRLLHGLQQVAVVQAVHQVCDDLGVGLAGEDIAALLQFGAQLVVVLDDAVVHERDAPGRGCRRRAAAVEFAEGGARCIHARPGAEMRVRVVHRRRAVRGPARVRDAGARAYALGLHVGRQFGHTRSAARAPQMPALVHRDAAAVVAAVLQPLQALDQDGNDVALADRTDDAAHGRTPSVFEEADAIPAVVAFSCVRLAAVTESAANAAACMFLSCWRTGCTIPSSWTLTTPTCACWTCCRPTPR